MFEVQARNLRSARYWHSLSEHIDMEPEYQRRGGIWSEADQCLLIDSILNDYDIPKLYVADFTTLPSSLNLDRKRFAVIDGKQRLEAIFGFFEDAFPLSKATLWIDRPDVRLAGLYFSEIEKRYPNLASKIAEFPLPVMHVVTDEESRIQELFVRLNKGANLTGAEKRNAMIGPVPKEIRRLSEHAFFKACVRYRANRGQNLNAAAKVLRFELAGRPVDTKKRQLDDMVLGYENLERGVLRVATEKVRNGLDVMVEVFRANDILLSTQGNVPVYYMFLKALQTNSPLVREFLVGFERELRETRKSKSRRSRDYVLYDNAMRSTNDGSAYETRVRILRKRYQTWILGRQ